MFNYTSCPIVLSSIKTIGPTTSEELHLQSEAGRTKLYFLLKPYEISCQQLSTRIDLVRIISDKRVQRGPK
jgi:hypothetical protein